MLLLGAWRLVVAAHSDVGTGIGFGVECAGAHVSIPAKSFGRELTKSSPSTPQNLAMKARPVVFFYAFVRFGVVVVLMMMMAKSVVASFLAIGSAALFFSFRLHARQGLLWVDSMWVLGRRPPQLGFRLLVGGTTFGGLCWRQYCHRLTGL